MPAHMYWQNGLIKKHRQIPPLFTFSFRLGIHGEGLVRPPRQGTIYRCDVFLCNWRVGGLLTSWKCETWHIPGTEITCWRVRDGGEMEQERKSDGHDIRWNVWKDTKRERNRDRVIRKKVWEWWNKGLNKRHKHTDRERRGLELLYEWRNRCVMLRLASTDASSPGF